jgi:hypothetical protein
MDLNHSLQFGCPSLLLLLVVTIVLIVLIVLIESMGQLA